MNNSTAIWIALIILVLVGAIGLGFWAIGTAIKIGLYILLALLLIWAITAVWRGIKSNVRR